VRTSGRLVANRSGTVRTSGRLVANRSVLLELVVD